MSLRRAVTHLSFPGRGAGKGTQVQSSVLVEFGGGNGNLELLIGLELVGQGIREKEVACGGGNRSLLGVPFR